MFAADAAVIVDRTTNEFRYETVHVKADLFAQVAADHVGRIPDAVRESSGCRVEQNAGGIDARGTDDDHAGADAMLLFGFAVEIRHAAGEAAIVNQNARYDSVIDDLEFAGFKCRIDEEIR